MHEVAALAVRAYNDGIAHALSAHLLHNQQTHEVHRIVLTDRLWHVMSVHASL